MAAYALVARVLLATINIEIFGFHALCPSINWFCQGFIVREVDALGGGVKTIDKHIQMKMLSRKRRLSVPTSMSLTRTALRNARDRV